MDVAANLIEIDYEKNDIHITGFLGKPIITRGNRNFENFFVNGRYVKSAMISKSVEDAYRDFVMQHKFPFAVLHFHLSGENVDINVHPTKMELRFSRQQEVYNTVFEAVHRTLLEPELIQKAEVPDPVESNENKAERPERVKKTFTSASTKDKEDTGSPFLLRPRKENEKVTAAELIKESRETVKDDVQDEDYFIRKMKERVLSYHNRSSSAEVADRKEIFRADQQKDKIAEHVKYAVETTDKTVAPKTTAAVQKSDEPAVETQTAATSADTTSDREATDAKSDPGTGTQMDLFEENFLKRDVRAEYKLIGQVFDTYWLVEFKDNLYIIDQHAAHEKILYERTMASLQKREYTSQMIDPPIILSLNSSEQLKLEQYMEHFTSIGFEIEPFGGKEYAVRAVPANLFSVAKRELLMEMIDDLAEGNGSGTPDLINERVATMSCKAAVKGNHTLSFAEADKLIDELLELKNPYACPHGRPTIISMSKYELEKKFKRIV